MSGVFIYLFILLFWATVYSRYYLLHINARAEQM